MPGAQIFAIRQIAETFTHVRRVAGIGQHRIVHVPGHLPPRIEDYLLISMVGVQGGDYALQRIIEKDRTHAHGFGELKAVRGTEEWFVFAHRLALVVEDRPAAAYPARLAVRAGLGLDLFL